MDSVENNNVPKVEVDSDCEVEIIKEKLVSAKRVTSVKQQPKLEPNDMSTSVTTDVPSTSSMIDKRKVCKRPANASITIIDIDDENEETELGSSWKTLQSYGDRNDSVISLPSVIPLVSDDDESSDGGADDGEPAAKVCRLADSSVVSTTTASASANVVAGTAAIVPRSRRSIGSGLSAEYLRSFFRPIRYYTTRCRDHMDQFNRQIWRHFLDNIQNDKTFTWKMRVRLMLFKAISTIYDDCHLIAVGSTINGCGAYSSDMDLCLCLDGPDGSRNNGRQYAVSTLRKVQHRLMKTSFVRRCITIPAKVPILKMWFAAPYEALEVDLNVNNRAGIYNSYLLHHYSRVDDRFSAICLFVKHWAKLAGIGDAFAGTFNSYSLILMVVHFLQVVCDPPVLPNLQQLYPKVFCEDLPLMQMQLFSDLPRPLEMSPRNTQTVGELLIAFFKYYAEFDYLHYGISIADACVFPRSELSENTKRFKIFIEEPFDQQNTARCITSNDSWTLIQTAFCRAAGTFLRRNADPPNVDTFLRQFRDQ